MKGIFSRAIEPRERIEITREPRSGGTLLTFLIAVIKGS